MLWLKRNLFFVIGGAVSLALLGYAVFFLYTQFDADHTVREQLNVESAEFDRFDQLPYYPSKQNIATAKAETEKVNAYLAKARGAFKPMAYPNMDVRQFKERLSRSIYELTKQAEVSSVALPAKYTFSFEAQTKTMAPQKDSLRPLAEQLTDINTFCPIFFKAKINRLEGVRRYRVSTDDPTGSSDYIEQKPTTNALTKAVFVPYEVTFYSFANELADAMTGLMRQGLIVRALTVDPAPPSPVSLVEAGPMATPGYTPFMPSYPHPSATPPGMNPELARRYGLPSGNPMMDRYGRPATGMGGGKDGAGGMSDELKRRYGLPGGGGSGGREMMMRYGMPPPPVQPPQPSARPSIAPPKSVTTVLDEKLLRINLRFDVMRQAK